MLVSAVQQCMNQLCVCIYPLPLESPTTRPGHLPRSSESSELSSLCQTEASHQPSVLHVVGCICQSYSSQSSVTLALKAQTNSTKSHFKQARDTSDQHFCWTVRVYTREVCTRCSLNAFYIFHYPICLPVEGTHHFHSIREPEGIWRGMYDLITSERTSAWCLVEGNCLLSLSRGITSLSAL